jgi:hypothetical protein
VTFDPLGWLRWSWLGHWKDLIEVATALGTAASAVAAALAVMATREVAERQESLTRKVTRRQEILMDRQLRQDLFEKRFDVYYSLHLGLQDVVAGTLTPEVAQHRLGRILKMAKFVFFRPEVAHFMKQVSSAANEYLDVLNRRRPDTGERDKLNALWNDVEAMLGPELYLREDSDSDGTVGMTPEKG